MTEEVVRNNRIPPRQKGRYGRMVILPVVLLVVMLGSISVWAWLSYSRKAAAVARISNPAAIFIYAGNSEDVRFLDLSGIDVENKTDENKIIEGGKTYYYKDFVFTVVGEHVTSYKLQLAYTTNNQFSFDLYANAQKTVSDPGSGKIKVKYFTNPDGIEQWYSVNDSVSPVAGTCLNKDGTVGSEAIALSSGDYHDVTYGTYTNVQKYAEPIYWRMTDAVLGAADGMFTHYYILRVKWDENKTNDKETDIIYISANSAIS